MLEAVLARLVAVLLVVMETVKAVVQAD